MNKPKYSETISNILTTTGIFSYLLNMFFLMCYDDYEMMPLVTLCLLFIMLVFHTFYYLGLYKFTLRKKKSGYETHTSYVTYRYLAWTLIILSGITMFAIVELIDSIF
jgi:hypothetical protein